MVNRVVVGQLNGQFVARVSIPGVDVLTATQIQHFMLHELYSADQVMQRGTLIMDEWMPYIIPIPLPMLGYTPYIDIFYYNVVPPATPDSVNGRIYPSGFASGFWAKDGQLTVGNYARSARDNTGSAGFVSVVEYAAYATRGR